MSMRYAVAMHRLKDAERSQDRSEQLSWAGNEMASVIRDGDGLTIDHSVAWAGLSMVHKTQHEIAAGFRTDQSELREKEDHAVYSLNQVSISVLGHIFELLMRVFFYLIENSTLINYNHDGL